MVKNRPLGVTLIGYFYIFGAIMLLLSVFLPGSSINGFGIGFIHGISFIPEQLMRIITALFALILSYGYLKLDRWGYWLMLAYSILFFFISIYLAVQLNQQPFIGNMIWSIIVSVYTYVKRNSFNGGVSYL